MELVVEFAAASLAVLIVGSIALVVRVRRRQPQVRDETVRAGVSDPQDQFTAASRATGVNAWMRPSGGGF
ncbi:hypothetical protein GCM10007382_23440 [Salinibacterium xinjiangense]|uniref:Uncharacterized protein n=1 Tax=Salinibacterium xinjiangense TaxID=386302 RepID=A0A2C8ZVK6_9MICO|nr:hypothetical protein GCM10007382_23440 [Salinibacterium xinjiangense]SOE69877.1 hypothetical protein SAMN06296378_2081 [Salinibacterium xinjiangense]